MIWSMETMVLTNIKRGTKYKRVICHRDQIVCIIHKDVSMRHQGSKKRKNEILTVAVWSCSIPTSSIAIEQRRPFEDSALVAPGGGKKVG